MINHDLIHKIVADAGGLIVGGYMRAWVSAGEPQDFGWDDIDIYNIPDFKKKEIETKIKEATNGKDVDFKYDGIVRNFYCNSWIFDGVSIYREETLDCPCSFKSDEEVLEETQQKKAVSVFNFNFLNGLSYFKYFQYLKNYGFTIHYNNGDLIGLEAFPNMHSKIFEAHYKNSIQN